MASVSIGIVLLALAGNAAALYDSSVCNILEKSCGLIPPPLPRNFEMKAERVDHVEKYAVYEETYFDYTNSRAKYKYLIDSIEHNYLFDYEAQQIVQWFRVHPGTSMKRDPLSYSCEAVNMDESDLTNIFGDEDTIYLKPKMFSSNQVLRYGGQYLYAFDNGTKLYDRDIQTNKFVGCVYDDSMNATLKNDYYFADTSIVQPSGGTPSSIITGAEDKPLSVPVKMHIEGRRYEGANTIPLNKTISVSWFKGEPQFRMETFQVPPWIHCNNYRKNKEIPKFPTAFSTRVVVTKFSVDILGHFEKGSSSESYEEIYYDSDRKLARRDFTPVKEDTDIKAKFGSYTPVSTIYDFNEGLRYTINKPSGRCYIIPIPENDFFDTEKDSLFRELATPEEMFYMQMDDMQYKGKAFARDIMCDVWNGQHTHIKYNNNTVVKETYFSTDGWHEIADEMLEFRVPVRHVIMQKLDDLLRRHIESRDFLKFKASRPKMASFDIQNCVELINHKRFAIELALNQNQDYSKKVFQYKFLFLEAAQLYIANKTEINTPLRVQRLHLRHLSKSSDRVFLVFSLLDKANLNNLPVVVGQKGKDLQEAINLLQKVVESGKFSVQFKNPGNDQEMISVYAEKGSLYSLTASGSLTKAPLVPAKLRKSDETEYHTKDGEMVQTESYEMELSEPEKSEGDITEEHIGMKSGNLALLSFAMLFIGVGIGIAVMYLYIRMYSDRQIEDKINLTPTPGPSTSAEPSDEGSV